MSLFTRTRAAGLGGVSTTRFSFEAFEQEEQQMIETGEAGPLTMAAADGETEIVEAAVETAELSADVDEAQRSAAVLDKAEDVAEVQSNIGNATENDVMAAETSQAVVTTALGDDETDTAEGSESWVGRRISNEGFVDWIKAAWQKLKDFVMSLWTKAKITWRKYINGTGSLIKRAKDLKEKLGKKETEKSESELDYGSWSLYFLDTDSPKYDKSASFVFNSIKLLKDNAKNTKDMHKDVDKLKDAVKGLLEKSAKSQSIEESKKEVEEFLSSFINGVSGTKAYKGSRFGSNKITTYSELGFGNKGVFFSFVANNLASLTANEIINSLTIQFADVHTTWVSKPGKDDKYSALDKSKIESIISDVEDISKNLETFFDKETSNIEKSSNELKKEIQKVVDDASDGIPVPQAQVYKAVTRLHMVPLQYLRAVMSKASWMVTATKAVLTFAEANVNNLKSKKDD